MKSKSSGKRFKGWILAISAIVSMLIAAAAQAAQPQDLGVRIERVALFKNGLGYFTSSATVPSEAATFRLGQLPVPSLGTFWVSYPRDMKVRSLVTSLDDVAEAVPVGNVAQLLQNNPGRKVTLYTNSKDMPSVVGTLVEVLPKAKQPQPPSPYIMDVRRAESARRYIPYQSDQLVVVKTDGGTVAINANQIMRADFADNHVNTSLSVESKQPRIRMELDAPAKGEKVEVNYLARGITWSPSYRIDISDATTARFSAKALVVNEAADLERVHIDLVTGFPNIQFAEVNSPLAMSQNLEDFFKALTGGRSESRRNSHMMQQAAIASNYMVYSDLSSPPMPGYSTAREGTAAEDLFLYPVENLTLSRGETACIPLFTADVPYKHIYTWKIPEMLDSEERYGRNNNREQDDRPLAEEVWHCCRLVNNLKMPWTTSPAEFIKNGQFTGQDTCYYTAPGAETTIRINRAMNVMAESAEFEMDRRRNAKHFHGCSYDLVKVRGELRLQNLQDKSVDIEVKKNLSGEVFTTSPAAKDIPTAKGLKRVNPRHILVWDIKLEAGQKQTLGYTYEVYIRN